MPAEWAGLRALQGTHKQYSTVDTMLALLVRFRATCDAALRSPVRASWWRRPTLVSRLLHAIFSIDRVGMASFARHQSTYCESLKAKLEYQQEK